MVTDTMTKTGQLEAWARLAEATLEEHGLAQDGWRFRWDNAKRRWGQCTYGKRLVTCSQVMMLLNPGKFEDTLLHEVAHALVGPGKGHGAEWKAKARELGARPRSCTHAEVPVPAKWEGVCTTCDRVVAQRHKLTKAARRFRCSRCYRPIKRGGSSLQDLLSLDVDADRGTLRWVEVGR